jgi:glutathione peroxidase
VKRAVPQKSRNRSPARSVICRTMKRLLTALLTLVAMTAFADSPLYTIPLKDIDGKDTTLQAHAGKVLLIVNVASQCGYTSQYAGLEALHQKVKDRGVVVLGFPCNDFGGQEPGTAAEIKVFCQENYKVSFPMFDKVAMDGPLYTALTSSTGKIGWNFEKILVGKDGNVITKFSSDVEPESAEITGAIEQALK